MAARSSLFALVATACLAASYPASAVPIHYEFNNSTACFTDKLPEDKAPSDCRSFSGHFDVDKDSNGVFAFSSVSIDVPHVSGIVLPDIPNVSPHLSSAMAEMGGTDRRVFHASGDGTTVFFFLDKPIDEGGSIHLTSATTINNILPVTLDPPEPLLNVILTSQSISV